jgi:RNA polymerase II-associated factor 1
LNAVEVNYRWKLHNEPDLGVPLAPSAMDPSSYTFAADKEPTLDPDDLELLDWKGSMGDTAAEELKKSRDNARAAARMALLGKSPGALSKKSKSPLVTSASTKKAFSRVLNEGMQSWMKKTTYMSNDYTRKVHDFKSLAKTKQELAEDLEVRHQQISQRRTASAIAKTFDECKQTVHKHPSKKNVKPVAEMEFLPDADHWGQAYTHVVVDKAPGDEDVRRMDKALIANVQKKDASARMTCQLFVPADENDPESYQAVQQYELDVIPLKEEDTPHVNFCIWVDPESGKAAYVPIASRVQLSIGRPLKKMNYKMKVSRRAMNDDDKAEVEERIAEIDADVEEKLTGGAADVGTSKPAVTATTTTNANDDDSDDSDREDSFMNTGKAIVAEN